MPTFLFTYRVPPQPMDEAMAGLDDAGREARSAAWMGWFQALGSSVVEIGNPVNDASPIGQTAGTRLGGYSLIDAPDAAAAAELAKGCPAVEFGGGVEIGDIVDVSGSGSNGARAGSAASAA
ncbi:MAG TPA: YciI family protein [Solirubrobacteraceae bacterium]|nr:YciI family protein [Solirubrobacteraceae bacterium]